MPLHVHVYINEEAIESYHIGRIDGTTDPDSIGTYLVCKLGPLISKPSLDDWDEFGFTFTHRYGDGATVCVAKALQQLLEES
jgi:hypothetical protein